MANGPARLTAPGRASTVPEDGTLVTRRENIDRAVFAQLVAQHQARVTGLAYRLLGWGDEVEDVVQDVFLSAYRNLEAFRGDAAIATWLTKITVNQCRTQRRKRLKRLRVWRAATQPTHRAAADSARASLKAEAFAQVREAVRALPHRYREVVVLRYLEEMSIAETASILGVAANTVEVRLSRARDRLRERLGDLAKDGFRES